MTKSFPLLAIAQTASVLANEKHEAQMQLISTQAIAAAGGNPDEGAWHVDFEKGTLTQVLPDVEAPPAQDSE